MKIYSPWSPWPQFEILFVKVFSLKQKTYQILPATTGKIKFCHFNSLVFLQTIDFVEINNHMFKTVDKGLQ